MRALFGALLLGAALSSTAPAFAAEPEPVTGAEAEGAAHEGGKEGAEEHATSIEDNDHDGVPNWRDADAGEDYAVGPILKHALNLILLLGVLGWAASRPVSDALRDRAQSIRKELTDAARERDEARQRHEELSARLGAFEEEVRRMKADAEAEGKAEEERLVARANEEAKRVQATAERNIRDELSRARNALRQDAVDLAVQLAEQTLRGQVRADDQRRLARELLESLNREVPRG